MNAKDTYKGGIYNPRGTTHNYSIFDRLLGLTMARARRSRYWASIRPAGGIVEAREQALRRIVGKAY